MRVFFLVGALLALIGCTRVSVSSGSHSNDEFENKVHKVNHQEAALKRLEIVYHALRTGNMSKAKENLEKAKQHDPKMPEVYQGFGYYYQTVGELDKAEASYRRAVQLGENNAEILNHFGAFLCAQKRFPEADDYFTRAIAVRSYTRVFSAYENAGLCAMEDGKLGRAERYFEKALNYNKRAPNALLEMGYIAYDGDRLLDAKSYLNRFQEVAQNNARSLWLGIQVYYRLGDNASASSLAFNLERLFPKSRELNLYQEAKASWLKL